MIEQNGIGGTLAPRGSGHLVLVIEDDLGISGLIAEALSEEGFQVIETTSAQAGLRIARQRHPSVIVLDLILPDGSGLEVLDGVKRTANTRDIPVLAISGYDRLLEDPATLRAEAVLPKPFSMDRLVEVVERFSSPHSASLDRHVRESTRPREELAD